MSARGHRPRNRAEDNRVFVGGVSHHVAVGVGQWTVNATRDPFDTVWFEDQLDAWIAAGSQAMDTRNVAALRAERKAAS